MHETVHRWGDDAAKLAGSSLWLLADPELLDLQDAVHQAQQALAALQVRVVQEAVARGLPAGHGHRSVTGWLRSRLRLDPHPARELAHAAASLRAHPTVEQALLDGRLDLRQATVIAAAVDAVPGSLSDAHISSPAPTPSLEPEAVTARAESMLIEMAGQLPAYQLRKLGDRILAWVAPEIAEQAQEAALHRAEARAHRSRGLTFSMPVDGMVRVSGRLGVEDAATVTAALHPLTAPSPGDDRSFPQRRADALVDVCRLASRTDELPRDGGEPPQLAVTVQFDALTGRLHAGRLPDGEPVTNATARRLACDARILPMLLGSASQVLDAGRSRRLATGALRRALVVRDNGCAFPGCDRPARWCDAHHLRSWFEGGATDLDNLVLLCRHHHRLVHDPAGGWEARMDSDRLPTFIPPPWIDPQQQPCRNLFHPRT